MKQIVPSVLKKKQKLKQPTSGQNQLKSTCKQPVIKEH